MENEWQNPDLDWCSKQICSAQTHCVAENVEGFHHIVKKMLKIIEGGNVFDDGSQINHPNREQLIALLDEIILKHQLLAEQYDHLVDDLHCNMSSKNQKESFAATVDQSDQDSSFLTPDQKLVLQKNERQAVAFDFPQSSGGSSFINSGKEGSESSAPISSDSDLDSYNSSPNKGFTPNSIEIPNGKYVGAEAGLTGLKQVCITNGEQEIEAHDTMLLRIIKYEEELRTSKRLLLSSKQEVLRLNNELKNSSVAMDSLKTKLELAKNEVKVREDDLNVEKRKVSELQIQVATLETEVIDSSYKIGKLEQENKVTTVKLQSSEGKLAELNHKISERDYENRKLTVALQDASRDSEIEKAQFQSYNYCLSEKLTLLEARLVEREERIKMLEDEVKKCETSKIEMKSSYEALEIRWQGEIEILKAELTEKRELVESLNQSQDGLKLKYDMLMTENDGFNAKAQTLGVELCAAEYNIQQMEIQIHQLQLQNAELIAGTESMLKLRDELRSKVKKQEEELEQQAAMIKDRAEEKREAIRQLCLSLEHYRSWSNELRQAYIGQMRHAVIAS